MKNYEHYQNLAIKELERIHGNSTVDFRSQIQNNLHTTINTLVLMEMVELLEKSNSNNEAECDKIELPIVAEEKIEANVNIEEAEAVPSTSKKTKAK